MRGASSSATWSRGVELARAGAVAREGGGDGDLELRVEVPGAVVALRVVLYPGEEAWECDCAGREDPCPHVAAAVIAVRRAEREGAELPAVGGAGGPGHLRYAFRRGPEGLLFERLVVREGAATPFRTTLAAVASGRAEAPPLAATQADQEVELALGPQRRGVLPRGVMRRLLRLLEGCPDVRLDGEPVRTSPVPVGFRARLDDDGSGFVLSLVRDPPVETRVGEDLALCDGTLHELGSSGLTGSELEAFAGGRRFTADQAGELVSEILPALRARIPVDVGTDRLPDTRRVPPELVIEVERVRDALAVLPLLVYGDPPRARVDGDRLVPLSGALPVRDRDAEALLVRLLRDRLGLAPGRRTALGPEDAVDFVEQLEGFPARVRGEAHRHFRPAPALEPVFSVRGDGFDLHFASRGAEGAAEGRADGDRVLRAWRRGDSVIALDGGGLAPLPSDWLARHGRALEDLLRGRDAAGRVTPALLPDLARLCEALDVAPPPAWARLRPIFEAFRGIPPAELPADLTATLRPYQRDGVAWLRFLAGAGLGALLADDMGLGKTLQALCALEEPALVVCPTSVLHGWRAEAERFRPALDVAVYHGPDRALRAGAALTLTTWAILRLDREALSAHGFRTVVLDEAQAIKNPDSQVARAAFALRAEQRIALTGTPVENRLDELWSQLHFTNPGLLGSRSDFEERYARPIAAGDVEVAERLRARTRPFVLRRRKSEVAPELPERQDVVLRCELSAEERAVYDAVRAATLPEVLRELRAGGGVMAALEALLRLRQACCHPGLVPGHDAEGSSKLELLMGCLETALAEEHKALVFSQWTSLLDRIEPALESAGVAFTRLDGSTRDRAGVVDAFSREDGPPVLLLSLRAGGTGLNLTAADHVFLMEPWWNPAVEDQAADRAHRIGQTRPVLVHRLVARDTVEERMLALQEHKRALARAALEGGAPGGGLSREDLLAVLEPAPGE